MIATRRPLPGPVVAVLIAATIALLALPAAAQGRAYPRVGVSAALDRQVAAIDVHADEPFQLHIVLLPAEGEAALTQDYGRLDWAILEPCCGGAAEIVSVDYNVAVGDHDGDPYSGVTTTGDCLSGESVLLCTITLRMATALPGRYSVLAGPLTGARSCEGDRITMSDMVVEVNYTTDAVPTEPSSLSGVKHLFE